ncbi:MAG: AAA family ATPase [Opitutaceae bacterium]|nr:AAA family ATPase [Opitutaceae bacterium]
MIASIAFRKFKALRNTRVALAPFNLVIGPNGSGKTSLIESVMRLKTLAKLPLATGAASRQRADGPAIEFNFAPPHEGITAQLGCVSDLVCDTLRIIPEEAAGWAALRDELADLRSYTLQPEALAGAAQRADGARLSSSGHNLAAVLAHLRSAAPAAFAGMRAELFRIVPEFAGLELVEEGGQVSFALQLTEGGQVPADELSQGTLCLVAVLALAFDPDPPRVLCIEEIDRGFHPRTLREVRDALYRLSHPRSAGLDRRPTQIITTTHSPYFIDLFRDHPDEIIISKKQGRAAQFSRLSDRADLGELLGEGSLGDMWFSGILGGVPEER